MAKATKKALLMQDTPTADSLCRNGARQYLREIPPLLRPLFSFVLKSTSKGRPRDRGLRARIHVAGTGNGQMVVYESTAQSLLALAAGAFGIGTTEFSPMGLLPVIADGVHVSIPQAGMQSASSAVPLLRPSYSAAWISSFAGASGSYRAALKGARPRR